MENKRNARERSNSLRTASPPREAIFNLLVDGASGFRAVVPKLLPRTVALVRMRNLGF